MVKKPYEMAINHFVIDTNVLISAFVFKSKKPADVLKLSLSKGKVVISADLISEYKSTLLNEKFDPFISKQLRETELSLFIDCCDVIVPHEKITACRDADDNMCLELAVSANASCIVTGDKDLLDLNPFRGISIMTPNDFLNSF